MDRSTDADQTAERDRDLVARMAAGDTTALGALYDRYGAAVFGLALRIVGDRSLAEDVVEEAFMEAWRNPKWEGASGTSAGTWLTAIVHQFSIDAVRRRDPSEVDRQGREVLGEAPGTLETAQREAIELAYFGGLTLQEIAHRTGVPLAIVKIRVGLGMQALRGSLTHVPTPADGAANPGWETSSGTWLELPRGV